MSGTVAERNGTRAAATPTTHGMTPDQVELIKRTICKGATDDELALFITQCNRTGLDPFSLQIHAVKRWNSQTRREEMAIQTGIDGFRLIAERTDRYAPGREPTYQHDAEGRVVSATAYVKKLAGGTWHEVAATAYWAEYVQTNKEGNPTKFWTRMPHLMLAKCAEALALRKAFPMELSGLYTDDEMGQADRDGPPARVAVEARPVDPEPAAPPAISPAPAMVKRELAAGIVELANLKNVEPATVEGMLLGMVNRKHGKGRKLLTECDHDELVYAANSVQKSLVAARLDAQAEPAAPLPQPDPHPTLDREPGIDPEDDEDETADEDAPPPPAEPAKGKLPKPVIDRLESFVREAGLTWAQVVARSQRDNAVAGRSLAAGTTPSMLSLDDAGRLEKWLVDERKRRADEKRRAEEVPV